MPNLPLPVQAVIAQENLTQVLRVGFQTMDEVLGPAYQSRHDLVFIDTSCFQADKPRLLSLIAKARDQLSSRVLVEWQPQLQQEWQEADFLALALRRRALTEQDGIQHVYFSYDLKTYKQVPDWLNARFWANPHMWNKARW